MNQDKNDILPCPECKYPEPIIEYDDGWDVICPRCGLESFVVLGLESDDRDACIKRWNTSQPQS